MGKAAAAGGLLDDLVGPVLAGSLVLPGALAGFALGAGPASSDGRGRVILCRVAILGLASSVVVGSVLANSSPGS